MVTTRSAAKATKPNYKTEEEDDNNDDNDYQNDDATKESKSPTTATPRKITFGDDKNEKGEKESSPKEKSQNDDDINEKIEAKEEVVKVGTADTKADEGDNEEEEEEEEEVQDNERRSSILSNETVKTKTASAQTTTTTTTTENDNENQPPLSFVRSSPKQPSTNSNSTSPPKSGIQPQQQKQQMMDPRRNASSLPFTMQLMKPFWAMCCQECGANGMIPQGQNEEGGESAESVQTDVMQKRDFSRRTNSAMFPDPFHVPSSRHGSFDESMISGANVAIEEDEWVEGEDATKATTATQAIKQLKPRVPSSNSLPMLLYPGGITPPTNATEKLIHEYISSCSLYGCSDRINAGVLTTMRFSLPSLRVSGSFHDADMLALTDILLKHCNSSMSYVRRIDLSIASREGKMHGKRGIRSHGAYALSKVLQKSRFVREVFVPHNRIGPYGASALFVSASTNATLKMLMMRGCRIGQKGAEAFVEHICQSEVCGLKQVDLSANRIGFGGCIALEEALTNREKYIEVDMEGNLVFQEIMNTVTHGLGIILSIIGSTLLSRRVQNKPSHYYISCAVYSASLLVLYTSSTLYHSFFALRRTKSIMAVLDHCAIYVLIAGSYTPFLRIALHDNPLWSNHLLVFIWVCCFGGLFIETFYPTWKYKPAFSLAMYLGMGWCCVICLPDLVEAVPSGAIKLLVAGGVGYTSGVPFFVRNNNLDHSIWHMFVLAGSMFHWFGVYFYVATLP